MNSWRDKQVSKFASYLTALHQIWVMDPTYSRLLHTARHFPTARIHTRGMGFIMIAIFPFPIKSSWLHIKKLLVNFETLLIQAKKKKAMFGLQMHLHTSVRGRSQLTSRDLPWVLQVCTSYKCTQLIIFNDLCRFPHLIHEYVFPGYTALQNFISWRSFDDFMWFFLCLCVCIFNKVPFLNQEKEHSARQSIFTAYLGISRLAIIS